MRAEERGEFLVVVLQRGIERAETAPGRRVGIRSVLEQDRGDFARAGRRGAVERVDAELVVGKGVHVGPVFDQQSGGPGTVEEGRVVERREVIVGTRLRQSRLGAE